MNILKSGGTLFLAHEVNMGRANSPGPGLWTLDLGPSGPDLGPGPGPELDNNVSLTWSGEWR